MNAETGELTSLTGDALAEAINAKKVISRGAYRLRKLVNAQTGEPTLLTGAHRSE